jgi:hypothetical protein
LSTLKVVKNRIVDFYQLDSAFYFIIDIYV